ncbi:MAG: TIGR03617 family F420-dependent LLM class oxidoreductase [Gammaproteobacteria bacterium]|nr:TIGR03617 family F420-dependent LLM class oxidoreductase [Gammaproteobacteria bacterium]
MKVFTTIPQDNLRKVPAAARAIEAAGYDGIMTMENAHEPFLPLAVAATVTERVELITGIAIAFARSPMVVANAGWDLQAAAPGRVVLGLGSQIKAHNEHRFSVAWSAPAPRMREYVQALRAIWACWKGEGALAFRGEHYRFTLMTPNFIPEDFPGPLPAVTIAAVGPAMLRVAGEVCDGVRLHPFCTRAYLEQVVLPELATGWARGGRRREHFEISGGGFIATGPDDEAVARMVEWVRYRVAFYASTPAYWPVLAQHGLEELGAKLNRMTKAGQWDRIAAEIPDDVVNLFAAIGRHDEIAAAIAKRFGGASDAIFASVATAVPADLPPDLVQDIRRLPASFTGFLR